MTDLCRHSAELHIYFILCTIINIVPILGVNKNLFYNCIQFKMQEFVAGFLASLLLIKFVAASILSYAIQYNSGILVPSL